MRMTGACEQAPMQATDDRVNFMSVVVLPSAIPSSSSRASVIWTAPATWQAVPWQTSMMYSPTGESRNWL